MKRAYCRHPRRLRDGVFASLPRKIILGGFVLFVFSTVLRAATVQVQVAPNGSFTFSPSSVSIQAGDTMQWIWKAGSHSTTSGTPGAPNGLWDSGVHGTGFTFSRTFPTAGSFSYFCTPHGLCCNMVGTVNVGVGSASPTPIPKSNIRVQLLPVATGLTAPGSMVSPADGSGRQFIVQQTGQVLILKNGSVSATPFLDVSSRMVSLDPGYDERGLLGFAFHPDFNKTSAAGFHKIYTYTSEPVSGTADFTVPHSFPFDHQDVLAEWQVSGNNPDKIDTSSRREVVRIDHPQSNHNAGQIAFRPSDRYLYISLGDGGAGNDVGDGHNPTTGNGQDMSTALGKILRIDPLDPALTSGSADPTSANGKYRVPITNPFVALAGPMAVVTEIYDLGLRNPYRFGFDATTDQLIIGDVGQNNVEEVDLGGSGKNYGWNRKEGSYLFDPASGAISPDPAPDPSLTEPVGQYSHTDGIALIGGFIYRGALLPALSGKYVFGDLALNGNGRLFDMDLATGVIQELRLGTQDLPLGLYIKGFAQDSAGEMYVLADSNVGPSGTGGRVLKIATIQPQAAISQKVHGGTPGNVDLLAGNPAIECRSSGTPNDHQIIFTFSSSVSIAGASVTPGNGGTGSLNGAPSGSGTPQITVNLTEVSNAQKITVTLLGVNDSTTTYDCSVQMGVLLGDVNANGVLTNADVSLVKAQVAAGGSVTSSNFRNDVNANGVITNADVSVTKAQVAAGAQLP
jgi:glucose/arabinose dehydrogenase/plastocyanin